MACRYSLFALHSSKNLLKATVLDDIWPEILFFTSVAAVVCVVTDYTHYDLGISNVLLVVLGNIIILQTILSFRTASASERYNEARSLWGSLCTTSKNLAQAIWIHIPNARTTENGEQDEIRGIIEKKSMINVIQALVVSAKHFVRDEKGVDYVDLWPLICWLPTFQITPDHPYWYKLDFNTSSSTFVGDSQSPPHLSSRASFNPTSGHHYYRQSSGDESATDVESDGEGLASASSRKAKTSLSLQLSSDVDETSPLTQSPTMEEAGGSSSILNGKHYTSPETTLLSSDSGSQSPPSLTRARSQPRYHLIPNVDADSESEPQSQSATLKSRRVRFNSQTLVNPPVGFIPSQLSSDDEPLISPINPNSLHTRIHCDDIEEELEAELLHNPCSPTARSIYSRILPYVPNYDKLKPAANPPKERLRDVFPLWRFIAFLGRRIRGIVDRDSVRADGLDPRDRRKRNPYVSVECSVPWQVWLVLSSYLAYLNENKLMPDRAIEKVITETILALQDIISQLERLTNTPLPFAYQVHIRMCTWLYLFFLPFQLFDQFKYITIPIVALFTFIFVGFMEIGEEIENPFDYDPNDLNLDQFCLRLQRELHEITAQIHHDPTTTACSSRNFPFAPVDMTSAETLINATSELGAGNGQQGDATSIQRTLLHCWREMDTVTRKRA